MKNKKNSAMKKLIPATSMLLVSATMLTASTYAWFTMSREVEVTGLKMTATVPEDLQISVGNITDGKHLNDTNSFVTNYTVGSGTNVPSQDNMWGNTVNISQYYEFGRLIPASSNNGTNIFFTPDATKEGKDVKESATFYQAAAGLTAQESGSSLMATLHPKTSNSDAWKAPSGAGYSGAVTWSNTKDDGYYVDVPVWIRSSSDSDIGLTVKGYVRPATDYKMNYSGAEVELYKATRVAILSNAGDINRGTSGVVNIMDGSGADSSKWGWNSTTSIINYYGTEATHNTPSGAVYKSGSAGGSDDPASPSSGNWNGIYTAATVYDGTTSIATIPGSGNNNSYGTPRMLWIRVWLEGEDPECWNQNQGQDWNISLKFEKTNV